MTLEPLRVCLGKAHYFPIMTHFLHQAWPETRSCELLLPGEQDAKPNINVWTKTVALDQDLD